MQLYEYSGINQYGERVRGQMGAKNISDVELKLKNSQIDILTLKPKSQGLSFLQKSKVSRKEVILITFQFEQLLRAGVPLMEILNDLRDSFDNPAIKDMLTNIHQSMEGGDSFADALSTYSETFGEVYITLVRSGEQTGQLEEVLADLGAMIKWEDELAAKAKKIMVYPTIVAIVVIGVITLMMVFLVPQLLSFIGEMGSEVGWATKSLVATSNFVQAYIIYLLIAPFLLVYIVKAWLKRSSEFLHQFDRALFKIKLIGPVLYNLKIARLANTLAVMYRSGVSFTDAMEMASGVVSNAYLENNVKAAIKMVEEGMPIHLAFEKANVFPILGLKMIRVGERSGNMDQALTNVGYFYDREAKEMIEKIEPAIEPLLTIVMAVMVGWVLIAVLGPIYDTMTQVDF
ncbi:type II secretion system F family protein [Thiomicrospira microaerophila]|uniref:type II secretion system F family protein n=1 Tax=Thiomicrospira microaerophila TaxID=406020 RepID=UPI00200FFFFB|nr:type II secretion system F family protein [Thiomicrospira microaerophila]UQB43034.1 type II secretion system F family protein [Thiomicrospira microaerophila]